MPTTRFQPSFSDFQTLNPTSDIINVYSDVFKFQIFFVSGTVIRLSIIVYPEDARLAALNFVPLNDCVIQTFTIGYPRLFSTVPDTKKIRIFKTSEYTLIISEVGLRV
jgi:hypothetical protein